MSTEPTTAITCVMTHTEPFDFAQCETHDETFSLGSRCKFYGREMWEVFAEEADEQRQRAVMAEYKVEQFIAILLNPEFAPELRESIRRSIGTLAPDAEAHRVMKIVAEALIAELGWQDRA
jgi:hypothetical protein